MLLTDEMKKDVLAKAEVYLAGEKNEAFRNEVEEAIRTEDWESLYDRFYTALAFGTAGMRGVIGGGTNRINTFMVRKVTQGLAEYCLSVGADSTVVIAFDSRHYSPEFAKAAALVLAANKVKTYLYDTLHPVPMLSFAVRNMKATAGIVITASHNPAKYNGYKVYWSDGGQVTPPHDIEIARLANAVTADRIKDIDEDSARESGYLCHVPESVDEAYYEMVISSLRRPELVKGSPITVAYTPLHGSGNVPVRHMLKKLGIRCCVVAEQEEPNGAFPTVKLPNPESHEAMSKVIELAKEVKADIVLGTDPDADRMGLAIPTNADKTDYLLLTGNQIATLLADYLITTHNEMGPSSRKPLIVKSLVTTDLVQKIAVSNGGDCKDVLTGFKYIAEQMDRIDRGVNKDNFFLFGCEESYGFLTVNDVHDKDAVSSAVAAVEMMCHYASKGITLQQRLDSIYAHYGYYTELVFSRDYEGAAGKEQMKKIMADMRTLKAGDTFVGREIAKVEDLLGENTGFPKADVIIIRFTSGEKLVVRPSGTEPKIKYYIFLVEGKGGRSELEAGRERILDEFKSAL
ncbi:MAG: phospho-sugar mutase [Bullifex sp.]|nr:phospho-sugar mutase [Bullifex sp.]MDY5908949.1 phospho-sugar mutase [Bullifex sp.]